MKSDNYQTDDHIRADDESIPDRSISEPEKQVEQLSPEDTEQIEAIGAAVEEKLEPELGRMRIDLHCHSEASADCITRLHLFPPRCQQRNIQIQAITDHNEIWGAKRLTEMVAEMGDEANGLTIIVGEEVSTKEGEIIGLFLQELIPAGLSPEETVKEIKDQGGLVLLPHGFDPLKRFRLKENAIQRIAQDIDIVETFNARISRPHWNRVAVDWCKEHNVFMSAGSDAHTLADIGSAWVETPYRKINGPQDLLDVLEGGVPEGSWTHPTVAFAYKMYDRARRWPRRWLRLSQNGQ